MSDRHARSDGISEQDRNRLVEWEMEFGHPLELDADLIEPYERLREGDGP